MLFSLVVFEEWLRANDAAGRNACGRIGRGARRHRLAAAAADAIRHALDYVLITPARNEAAFIERTMQSVIAQTILPKRWVIVSDGSTDGTDEIVRKYQPGANGSSWSSFPSARNAISRQR